MRKILLATFLCLIAYVTKAEASTSPSLRLAVSTPCEMSLIFYSPIKETIDINGTQLFTYNDFEYEDGYVTIKFDAMSERATTLTVRYPTGTVLCKQAMPGGYFQFTIRVKVYDNKPMIYLLFTDN